jgi:hypothetical protein
MSGKPPLSDREAAGRLDSDHERQQLLGYHASKLDTSRMSCN